MRQMLLTIVAILGLVAGVTLAGPRDALWHQVDDAIKQGLPKTAIGYLEQIIPGALQDQAHAEATKAICLKIVYEAQIQSGQAGGEDHSPPGPDRRRSLSPCSRVWRRYWVTGTGSTSSSLPLAVHAADRDRRATR